MKNKSKGQIQVTVITKTRMEAINKLAEAVVKLSTALNTPIEINIKDCVVTNCQGDGVVVYTTEGPRETSTFEVTE